MTRLRLLALTLAACGAASCGSGSDGNDDGSTAGAGGSGGGVGSPGGAHAAGGSSGRGGTGAGGGLGGASGHSAGGAKSTGGSTSAGGAKSTGGSTSVGGGKSAGGSTSAGGAKSAGGSTSAGGSKSAGGMSSAGGSTSTGGAAAGGQETGGGGGDAIGAGGMAGAGGDGSGGGAPGMVLSGDIDWTGGYVVAAGETLTLAAGSTVHVGSGASIDVAGTLIAAGTPGAPVTLQSVDHAGAFGWAGLVVEAGGDLQLSSIVIHDATTAFTAVAGSAFTIGDITVDTSAAIALIASSGSITGGALHADGDSATSDSVVISDASPVLSGLVVDNGNTNIDHIQVNGVTSSASFHHMDVSAAHCGFHFNDGMMVTIDTSNAHGLVYGLMVETSVASMITSSNFTANTFHVGECFGGSVTATGTWFDAAPFDDLCAGQTNTSPASGPVPGAGP